MWKSREDKLPPPSFFSMIVAHLQKAYPRARISREMMESLRPYFIEAWRNGKTAQAAAQTTCSCHHSEVVPSPVVNVQVAKGSVRPPQGAQRGEVFGAEALRPPAAVERLGRRLERLAQDQKKQEAVAERWGKRAQTARKESTKKDAEHKQAAASTKNATLLAEARRIEAEIKRLQQELNRPAVQRAVRDEAPPTPAAEPRSAPATKRHTKAETPPAAPATDENAAMLRAIQGLMPQLAGQLASEMAKDRSAK
jgi:hypothetical protein